ncbi:hypothetical protein DFR28_10576 [Arenicella xantha]|uniref:Uncharacterized protein n=1 Tax=Arenicella xantha TaxID=644221 RepID=A0A395JIY2_9GAMM|nr:hypothetical protein DFR28_10576 [Arenicella xantha]
MALSRRFRLAFDTWLFGLLLVICQIAYGALLVVGVVPMTAYIPTPHREKE